MVVLNNSHNMMKHFPTGLMSAAWLLFAASSSSRQFANAQTREQVDEAKGILEKMEDDVKAFRDKLEEVYKKRCDSQTYSSCIRIITMIARRHFPISNVHIASPNVEIPPPVAMEKAVAIVALA